MTEITVRISDERARRLSAEAEREGRGLSEYLSRQLEKAPSSVEPILAHEGPMIVPEGFDWTKAASWDALIEDADAS